MIRSYSIPLALADTGKTLTVMAISGGCGLRRRLTEMGLTTGAEVKIISAGHPGPLLIEIRGSRLGLGFGVAQHIKVKEAEDGQAANRGSLSRQS